MLRTIILALLATLFFSPDVHAEQTPTFESNASEVYRGPLAQPRLSKEMCVGEELCFWNFRTRLRHSAHASGVNFGGRYTLVEWGCGTSCQSGTIIDRRTGRMVWLPTASLGYKFMANSTLLIVNPYPRDYAVDGELPDWLYREFYVVQEGKFQLVAQDKGDLLDTPHPINPEVLKEIEEAAIAKKYCEDHPHMCTWQ